MTEPGQPQSTWQTAVNTGSGDQFVAAGSMDVKQNYFYGKTLKPRPIAQGVRDAAREAFAPVDRLEDGRKVLEAGPLLIIVGDQHTGRRTAALHLLETVSPARWSGMAAPQQRTVADLEVDWQEPDVDLILALADTDYVLDLSDEDQALPAKFIEDLMDFGSTLGQKGSRLVVLVTEEVWSDPSRQAMAMTVSLGRPNARDVAARHVERLTQDETRRRRVTEPPITEVIGTATRPVTAAALGKAAATIEDESEFRHHVDRISAWRSILDKHFGGPTDPAAGEAKADSRILLISAAAADGHPTALVYTLYEALRTEVKLERDAWKALTAPGFTAQLKHLEANVDADQVQLTQAHPGLDVAVFRYVWREYPSIRINILNWFGGVVNLTAWPKKGVQRIASLIAAVSAIADIKSVLAQVDEWSTGTQQQQTLATGVLRAALADEDVRSYVLATLRDWARSSRASQQRTVAEVCAAEHDTIKPQRALVRLKWIFQQPADAETARSAGRALRVLAGADSAGPLAVLDTISSWSAQWPVASTRGFLQLIADPDDLAFTATLVSRAHTDDNLQKHLRAGWTRAWAAPEARTEAAAGLQVWSTAIDGGQLDQHAETILTEALTDHIRETLSLEGLVLSDDDQPGPVRISAHSRIVTSAVDVVMSERRGAPDSQPQHTIAATDHAPGQW